MEQLNRIKLRGTLGVFRVMPVGDTHCATNYCYKDAEGCPVVETTWHLVTAWEGKGCPDLSIFRKGDQVHIIGRLRNRRYVDSAGVERTQIDIVASTLEKV